MYILPRFTSQFCLSLDNSPSNTSSNAAHLNRWSEVVPPKTALTFAALWDPEEGMVTFSGVALLESESLSEKSRHPDIFDDDHSQYISVDRDTDGGTTTSENTATLATFQDVFKVFLRHTPWDSREHLNMKAAQGAPRGLQTRASSMFDGLDVYSHDIHLKSKRSLQLSCIDLLDMESSFRTPSAFGRLRLRSDLMLDAYRSESDSESSSGSRPSHLVSPSLPLIDCCVSPFLQRPLLQFIQFSFSIIFHFSRLRNRAFRRRRPPRPTMSMSQAARPRACACLTPPSPNGLGRTNASHLPARGHSHPAADVYSANVGLWMVAPPQPPRALPHPPPGKSLQSHQCPHLFFPHPRLQGVFHRLPL